MEVVSDRRYLLPAPPDDVWCALARTDDYRSWWPWLRRFDARGLVAGDEWCCTIRPPLPYLVRFRLTLEDVRRPETVTARLRGDIRGWARIDLDPGDSAGTVLRLRAGLAPGGTRLAVLARLAWPLARRGHDWVVDTGARQFAERALGTR